MKDECAFASSSFVNESEESIALKMNWDNLLSAKCWYKYFSCKPDATNKF